MEEEARMLDTETYDGRAAAVWRLHDAGMPVPEIAKVTGIRYGTVKAIIMDAWAEGVAGWKRRHGVA